MFICWRGYSKFVFLHSTSCSQSRPFHLLCVNEVKLTIKEPLKNVIIHIYAVGLNWIFHFYILSLFTNSKMFKRTQNSLDNWLSNSYLTFRNKDFIFFFKVAILSFKSLRFITNAKCTTLCNYSAHSFYISVSQLSFTLVLLKLDLKYTNLICIRHLMYATLATINTFVILNYVIIDLNNLCTSNYFSISKTLYITWGKQMRKLVWKLIK